MTENVAAEFLPATLPANPMIVVEQWLAEARNARNQPNSNAMTLATCDGNGMPAARIVLCKGFDAELGVIDFYTNYRSRKAREIDTNPNVALVFHWDHQGRQVRIEGVAQRASAEQSDAYFASRPRASQIGAWASEQSEPIGGRDDMLAQFESRSRELDKDPAATIARPPHWGGYRIWTRACELWVEGAGRVHDRARFERPLTVSDDACSTGDWTGTRLQP